jgi:hypothetical protein
MVAPAPVSRKPGAKFRNLEDYLDGVIRDFNRELMGIAAAQSNWEALERLRRAEAHRDSGRHPHLLQGFFVSFRRWLAGL